MTASHPHIGSDFADILAEVGIDADAKWTAVRRVISWRLNQEMKRLRL